MHAALQAGARHFVVQVRGHSHHGGVDLADDGPVVRDRSARGVAVDHRGELNAGQARKLLGVKAAHVAGADHCQLQ